MASSNLSRFVERQRLEYAGALEEITNGRNVGHWIWFIFPQLSGLGKSDESVMFGVAGLAEARAYIAHPILGPRLEACAQALLAVEGRTLIEILGNTDAMKLGSCATLFAAVTPPGSVFEQLLAKYHNGERDELTLRALRTQGETI
ncbi:DUF1810 domain-containing protein [soil metagenome]